MKKVFSKVLILFFFVVVVISCLGCSSEQKPTLTGIFIKKTPNKVNYSKGEILVLDGLEVAAQYSDGTYKELTEYSVSLPNESVLLSLGIRVINVSYLDKTTSFEIEVSPARLLSLVVNHVPNKIDYWVDEVFDINGLSVSANYSDDSFTLIPNSSLTFSIEPGNKISSCGLLEVAVQYQNISTSFNINVVQPELTSVSVSQLPNKLVYYQGEQLDLTGLIVLGDFSNQTQRSIDNYTTNLLNNGVLSSLGEQVVTITAGTCSDQFTINVLPSIQTLSISSSPTKSVYNKGEYLDLEGLVISAHFSDGSDRPITDYSVSIERLMEEGNKSIIISFLGKSTSFQVTVNPAVVVDLQLISLPVKTIYHKGESIDLSGLVVGEVYSDDSIVPLNSFSVTPNNGSVINGIGNQTIIVSSNNKTCSFVIEVEVLNAETPIFELHNPVYNVVAMIYTLSLSVDVSVQDSGVITYKWYEVPNKNSYLGSVLLNDTNENHITLPAPNTVTTKYYYAEITNTINDNNDGGRKTNSVKTEIIQVDWTNFREMIEVSSVPIVINTYPIQEDYYNLDVSYGDTIGPYNIGQFEVTYDLWYEVLQWSINNGYSFNSHGWEGSYNWASPPSGFRYHPVVSISWADCIAWCNAYSEYQGKRPVYYYEDSDGCISLVKDAKSCSYWKDKIYCENTSGYRLPTSQEWFVAARGGISDYNEWYYPYAGSGSSIEAAWYDTNSLESSSTVGQKKPNKLGLYDMSGNATEFIYNMNSLVHYNSDYRVGLGGGYLYDAFQCQLESRNVLLWSYATPGNGAGFRLAQSILENEIPQTNISSMAITNGSSINAYVGFPLQLGVNILPFEASNKEILWSSSNTSIAMVDSSGNVDLIRPGVVTITAASRDGSGKKAQCTISSSFAPIGTLGPAGGKIFYADTGYNYSWTYLELAPLDVYPELSWGSDSLYINQVTGNIGDGYMNTIILANAFTGMYYWDAKKSAANYCYDLVLNGYNDWVLPSINELKLLAEHTYEFGLFGLGNGGGTPAWSSTSDGIDNAYMLYLSGGGNNPLSWWRFNNCVVFPIRYV